MSFTPDPLQTLLLWKMIFLNYEPTLSELKPSLKPVKRRDQLKEAELIDYVQRRKPNGRTAKYVILKEGAWDWAVKNLDAKLSDKSPESGPVLQRVLTLLKAYMETNNVSLYEFIRGVKQETEVENIEGRIREAYLKASKGQTHVRVRLAELRNLLPDIPREQLDDALRRLKRRDKIILYPLDDPQQITSSDKQAALNLSGRDRHIMILER